MYQYHSAHDICHNGTHNLELDRYDTEVQDLNCGPQDKVGLEGWQINVLELASQCSPSSALGDRHEGKEARQTW